MNREHFVSNITHWNNYWPLLWEALQNTSGDVIELGMGDGSTQKLHDYCIMERRMLYSYDNNQGYADSFAHLNIDGKHRVGFCEDWDEVCIKHKESNIGVLFVDHAPGERRKYDVALFCNIAKIIVVHDAEEGNDGGYRFSMIYPLFKYQKRFKQSRQRDDGQHEGADAIALSNFINVNNWPI